MQLSRPVAGSACAQVVWALMASHMLAEHAQARVCPAQGFGMHMDVADATFAPAVTLMSRQISSVMQGAPDGPQAEVLQVEGQYLPDAAGMHVPHSAGPQHASVAAQTFPPHS